MRTKMGAMIRSPLLHFLLLGLILAWFGQGSPEVVLDETRVAELTQQWARDHKRPPSRPELRAFLRETADEEILHREALRRNLDKLPVVRRRLLELGQFLALAEKDATPEKIIADARAMGLLESDPLARRYMAESMRQRLRSSNEEPPSEAEMRAFFEAHRGEFLQPHRVRLSHVFIAGHGPDQEEAANALFERLKNNAIPPEQALVLGDPFFGGQQFPLKTQQQLAAMMGVDFGERVIGLPEQQWARPIHSPFGWHIVWVHEVMEQRSPSFAAVRSQILNRMCAERELEHLAIAMEKLRRRYHVRIESPAMQDDGNTESRGV